MSRKFARTSKALLLEFGVMVAQASVSDNHLLHVKDIVRFYKLRYWAVDVPQVTCKALSLAYWRQAHEYLCVLRGHFGKIMNEDNKINFAYIAGKNHGMVSITPEQLNQVMNIIYGKEKV